MELTLTFCYKSGRKKRFAKIDTHPTEFFYGAPQFQKSKIKVQILEELDLGIQPPKMAFLRYATKCANRLCGVPIISLCAMFKASIRTVLRSPTVWIATTNTLGFYLAVAKKLGLINGPVLFVAMGLLPSRNVGILRWICRRLFTKTTIIALSRSEQSYLKQQLGLNVEYLPFGVDQSFWTPGLQLGEEDYVVAIGNDRNRDWGTLVAAWSLKLPRLRIITNLPVPKGPSNVEVLKGDWRTEILTDQQIRDQLRGARFVIVPSIETYQPAGQSVCLQAMACGKAVILSDISGVWDRDLLRDNQTVLLTEPGNTGQLTSLVMRLLDDPEEVQRIGVAARKVITQHLNVDVMATELLNLIRSCVGRS
jgi:glycosyltransferase involved in cell wall biosynthesis